LKDLLEDEEDASGQEVGLLTFLEDLVKLEKVSDNKKQYIFELVIQKHRFATKIWLKYLEFVRETMQNQFVEMEIFNRARRNCFWEVKFCKEFLVIQEALEMPQGQIQGKPYSPVMS
jgi:hypothetical protein